MNFKETLKRTNLHVQTLKMKRPNKKQESWKFTQPIHPPPYGAAKASNPRPGPRETRAINPLDFIVLLSLSQCAKRASRPQPGDKTRDDCAQEKESEERIWEVRKKVYFMPRERAWCRRRRTVTTWSLISGFFPLPPISRRPRPKRRRVGHNSNYHINKKGLHRNINAFSGPSEY